MYFFSFTSASPSLPETIITYILDSLILSACWSSVHFFLTFLLYFNLVRFYFSVSKFTDQGFFWTHFMTFHFRYIFSNLEIPLIFTVSLFFIFMFSLIFDSKMIREIERGLWGEREYAVFVKMKKIIKVYMWISFEAESFSFETLLFYVYLFVYNNYFSLNTRAIYVNYWNFRKYITAKYKNQN